MKIRLTSFKFIPMICILELTAKIPCWRLENSWRIKTFMQKHLCVDLIFFTTQRKLYILIHMPKLQNRMLLKQRIT